MTRRVKNVGSATATYTASASVPGFTATVIPSTPDAGAGRGGDLHGQVHPDDSRRSATWAKGSLTWTDGTPRGAHRRSRSGRSPIAAPAEVHGDASASGSSSSR